MSSNPLGLLFSRSTASPYAVSLTLGLGTISYFFWGNLACQTMGSISIPVNPTERKKLGLDTSKAVEIWRWSYVRGAIHFGISGVVSSLATLAAAFQIPAPIYSAATKKYLLLLSALLLSNGIYTFAVMMPTNNRLTAICDKITRERAEDPAVSPLTMTQEDKAETLLKKWKKMHYVRLCLGGMGWLGALAAYVATV